MEKEIKENDEEYKMKAGVWGIGLTKTELRCLLFWSCIGIARSKGGEYENFAPAMIKHLAKGLKYKLPYKPEFNAKIKNYFVKYKKEKKKLLTKT